MVLQILFWILVLLSAIGYFAPLTAPYNKAHAVLVIVLIAILGLKVFGNPLVQ